MYYHSGEPPPGIQDLKHGEWTVVIAHEVVNSFARYQGHPAIQKLRYAFITTPTLQASALKASAALPDDECCNYQEAQLNGVPSADTDTGQAPMAVTIADMKSFLENVATDGQSASEAQKLYKYWLEQTQEFATEGFGVCDEQEIDGIIQAMTTYSK